jgi:protein-S-isoprenylcysteine O-methyltransferase Ste14
MTRGHKHQKRFQDRDDLTGEHALGDAGQLTLACLFAATWIADSFFLRYTTFLNQSIPLAVRVPLAVVLLASAGVLAWQGLSTVFGQVRDVPGVIRTGVFGLVRHPIYLSEILLYVGLWLLSLSLAAAVVICLAMAFLHYISRWEEKRLLAQFGEDYAQYMREVPMWIPRLRRRSRG